VKVSEYSTWSRLFYQELFQKALIKRGHNPNLVQFIPGYGETGAALVKSPNISKIIFIGSPSTGRKVMEAAAPYLTPVVLELGGKDPFIVFEDADIDLAVNKAIQGSFWNCGQNCISAERVFVHKSIFTRFTQRIRETMEKLEQGWSLKKHSIDFGSMTMSAQMDKVDALVREAINEGAQVIFGGGPNTELRGLFYKPTVLAHVSLQMRIAKEEIFGPVMLILQFDNDNDVITQANATEYGLGCTIWSKNTARAESVARRIVSGMCVINDYGFNYMLQDLPFGGCKVSGFGHFNGPEGLRSLCRIKSITSENFLGSVMPSSLKAPAFSRYPRMASAATLMEQALIMFYGWGIMVKAAALLKFTKALVVGVKQQ